MNLIVCDLVICVAGIVYSAAAIVMGVLEKQFDEKWDRGEDISSEDKGLHRRFGCTEIVGHR